MWFPTFSNHRISKGKRRSCNGRCLETWTTRTLGPRKPYDPRTVCGWQLQWQNKVPLYRPVALHTLGSRKDMGCRRSHVAKWTFGRKHDRTENCSLGEGIQTVLQTAKAGSLPSQDRCSHFQFHNRPNWNMVKGRGDVELDALFTRVLWNTCWQNSSWPTPTEFCTTPAFTCVTNCDMFLKEFWNELYITSLCVQKGLCHVLFSHTCVFPVYI